MKLWFFSFILMLSTTVACSGSGGGGGSKAAGPQSPQTLQDELNQLNQKLKDSGYICDRANLPSSIPFSSKSEYEKVLLQLERFVLVATDLARLKGSSSQMLRASKIDLETLVVNASSYVDMVKAKLEELKGNPNPPDMTLDQANALLDEMDGIALVLEREHYYVKSSPDFLPSTSREAYEQAKMDLEDYVWRGDQVLAFAEAHPELELTYPFLIKRTVGNARGYLRLIEEKLLEFE